MIKAPYYLVDFNVSLANFEILINDVVAVSHESGGSIFSNYPINHFILNSGLQNIKVRLKPLADAKFIHKDADAVIKIQYLDASTMDEEQMNTVCEFTTQKNDNKNLPILEIAGEFQANVPYQLMGWSDAAVINVDNQTVINKIHDYYHRIYTLFKDQDVTQLTALLKKRYEETDVSMYLQEDNIAGLNNVFTMLNAENYVLEDFPDNPKIEFYGQNRLINLIRENYSPIISYLKKEENEEFGFPFYIHLPKGNNGFEIIR